MEKLEHYIYPKAEQEDADACAWVFSTPKKFEKYYYKHPPLQEKEVLIRITQTGLCQSDIHTGTEKWGQVVHPLCPGHEIIGVIEKTHESATKFKVGDKVMVGPFRNACFECENCKKGRTSMCTGMDLSDRFLYGYHFGGYSTHIQLEEHHVWKFRENLDEKTIAPIMCAGITTFLPLRRHTKKGEKIAVMGLGGLGHFAVQWAVKMGLEVDVFSSSHDSDELAKKLGAKEVFAWTKKEHIKQKDHYDAILNTLPCGLTTEQMNSFLDVLKPGGKFIQVGIPDIKEELKLGFFNLVTKDLQIIGSLVGGISDYEDMLQFAEEHGIKCYSEIFEWEDFPQAVDKLMHGKPHFRCVVNVDNYSKTFKN
jgi:uncharacterized zinc-type alcohol dehydrogenase-like protein